MVQALLDYSPPRPETDCDRIAALFRARPQVWLSAKYDIAPVCLAWRTRISDLRYQPYAMTIENKTEQHGRTKHSFYRWIP